MGMDALILEQSTGQRSFTFPRGFRSIVIQFNDNVKFIRVTDFRGNPIVNVKVTVGTYESTTDIDGIAEVEISGSGTLNVLLENNKTFKNYDYVIATEPLTRTYIFQPTLME
jgi:ribosome recycling factor